MIELDCGDNSCIFAPKPMTGMRTNGGCRCFKHLPTKQRLFISQTWQLKQRAEKRVAELEKAINDEPELPDDMPDEMWEAIRNDRDAMAEALRIVVRLTKSGILAKAAFSGGR